MEFRDAFVRFSSIPFSVMLVLFSNSTSLASNSLMTHSLSSLSNMNKYGPKLKRCDLVVRQGAKTSANLALLYVCACWDNCYEKPIMVYSTISQTGINKAVLKIINKCYHGY